MDSRPSGVLTPHTRHASRRPGDPVPARPRRALPLLSLALALWLVLPTALRAQDRVAGTVVDAATLQPLAGTQVLIAGTNQGAVTGDDGDFVISGLQGREVTLRISLVGYRTAERTVRVGTTDLRITLEGQPIRLEQVVVTGTAGNARRRELGNEIATLDASEVVQSSSPTDIQGLLGERVAGVRIRDTSGEVGTGGSISIRGVGTLALSGEPLVYVDGVRINSNPVGTGAAFAGNFEGSGPSRINDLEPSDIESIEVIKGPAAATLYGTEASNGVIQIITKKGQTGEPQVRVRVEQGATYLPSPEEIYQTNWGRNPATGELISQNLVESEIERGRGSPFSTGWDQGYGMSVSGGSEDIRYYASGSFDRDEGIVSYNWENDVNARTNFSFSPSESFQANLNVGWRQGRVQAASAAQPLTTHMVWGLPVLAETPTRGFLAQTPEAFVEDVEGKEDSDRTTVSLNLEHRPLDWLRHRLTLGSDVQNIRSQRLCRRNPQVNPCFNTTGLRQVDRQRSVVQSLDYSATGSARLTPDLTAETSVGLQFFREKVESETVEGQDLAVRSLETVSATAGDSRSAEETFVENRTLGMFVQEQLSWKDRLFLTGALRGDDNSAFGEAFDFVTYPKVSASWVLSEEPFFDVGFVNTLKLRGAWGKAGQQPNAFDAVRTYRAITGPGGTPGLTPDNIGNPDLKPETGEELEVGFDGSLFSGRLSLQFSYYDQTTEDAIVERPALPSNGFPGEQLVNVGRVSNRGAELGLDAEVLQGETLDWSLGLSLSRNSSEVEELGDLEKITLFGALPLQHHLEGFPLGSLFARRVVSAEFDDGGNLTNLMCEAGPQFGRGTGGAVPCSEANQVFRGHPIPDWVGTVNTRVRLFGNLEVYALADFESGHTRIDGDVAASHLFFRNSRCINTSCDPRLAAVDQLFRRGSSFALAGIMDAGFAKLRTVSATYTLPPRLAGLVGADDARVTVAGHNLATLWIAQNGRFGREVTDPEISDTDPLSMFTQESWPQSTSLDLVLRLSY